MLVIQDNHLVEAPLSVPLTDRQISKAWKWLDRAVRQSRRQRKVPAEFQNLDEQDWQILLQELSVAVVESQRSVQH